MSRRATCVGLLAVSVACAKRPPPGSADDAQLAGRNAPASVRSTQAVERTPLRVSMFPWIPDVGNDAHARYISWVEERFERENPDIDLVLAAMDPNSEMHYDSAAVDLALRNTYDVIEIDTILLGEVVALGHVRPVAARLPNGTHPAAERAVALTEPSGNQWAIPHWMCGHFAFTRDHAVAAATTVDDFAALTRALPGPHPDLLGDWSGSWDFGAFYLTASANLHGETPQATLDRYKTSGLDRQAVAAVAKLAAMCPTGADAHSDCVDGTFAYSDVPSEEFARARADTAIGYSERSSIMVGAGASVDEILLRPNPLGGGNRYVFTDAWVTSTSCSGGCAEAATAFGLFMLRADVLESLLLAEDVEGAAVPRRYLIPASQDVWARPGLSSDPIFRQIRDQSVDAQPFPNVGYERVRKTLRGELRRELSLPD